MHSVDVKRRGYAMSHTEIEGGREGRRITWIGVVANALLIAVKFVAGTLGNSQALIADAVHSVSDFFTDAVVLLGLRYGRRPPDKDHHFGHARIETMASAVVGLSLITVAVYLGYRSGMNIYVHVVTHPTCRSSPVNCHQGSPLPVHGGRGQADQKPGGHCQCMAPPVGCVLFNSSFHRGWRRIDQSGLARTGCLCSASRIVLYRQGGI